MKGELAYPTYGAGFVYASVEIRVGLVNKRTAPLRRCLFVLKNITMCKKRNNRVKFFFKNLFQTVDGRKGK